MSIEENIITEYVHDKDPMDISHIPLSGYSRDDIFNYSYWCNRRASVSMRGIANRKEAKAILLFGQTYFPEHFPSSAPLIHYDALSLFVGSGNLKAIAMPRGSSKSTLISFLLVLYRICFQKKKFIVIVSDSEDKAQAFIVRIKTELEHNHKLIRDFSLGQGFRTNEWSKTDFVTSTGIRVLGKGANQSIRGSIFRDTRPDNIVLDDIETNGSNPDEIVKFILTDVMPSVNKRGDWDINYIGTILQDKSALHQILVNEEFASFKVESVINENMLAPMLLSREEFNKTQKMYRDLGKMSIFCAEMMNNPMIADNEATFIQEYFQYFKEDEIDLTNMNVYIAYDVAMPDRVGKRNKADRSAIIVLATDYKENWYVVRVYANRDTPSKNRELLFNLAKKYKPNKVWMETISAQRAVYLEIKEEMKRKNIKFPFDEIPSHIGSKEARIEQLQPLYESGRIYHRHKDNEIIELERELLLFGRTPNDDRSDCLSFFLNRVKYPKRISNEINRKRFDLFDFKNNNSSSNSWKII